MNDLWEEYAKDIKNEQIAFAFDKNGCTPISISGNEIKQFVNKSFSDKARFYDATIFLLTVCRNDGFWKMLQMMDTTIILIAYDITIENIEMAKKRLDLNLSFQKIVGYPIYGNVILIAEKYLPQELLEKVQKLEERADPAL